MTNWEIMFRGFEAYLMLEKGLSANTQAAYLSDLNKLAEFATWQHEGLSPVLVKRVHLEGFLKWLNEIGLAENSQARLLSAIKAFYRYLLVENLITENPTTLLESPSLSRKLPSVLSVEEIDQILATIDLSQPSGHRDRAIIETLYACGLRVSELTELRLSNLFLDIGFVRVVGKGNKERFIPIGEAAIRQIELYRQQERLHLPKIVDEDVVFLNRRGRKLSRIAIFNLVKGGATKAGIAKSVSPHTFRHSFATHLLEGGANLLAIRDMLGHSSVTTTEIYTHLNQDFLKEVVLNFHPFYQNRNTEKR